VPKPLKIFYRAGFDEAYNFEGVVVHFFRGGLAVHAVGKKLPALPGPRDAGLPTHRRGIDNTLEYAVRF
jgi:hypothetical protein